MEQALAVREGGGGFAAALPKPGEAPDPAAAVAAVLAVPDAALDYAEAKLALDLIVDPTLDVQWARGELDRLTDVARQMAGPSASETARLDALRTLIYKPGPWNGGRAYEYDHADPFGPMGFNSLLWTLLATGRGNCVTMPVLFLILGERLGLDLALANAPSHILLRYRERGGSIVNLEATSGALPARLEWFRRNMPMSDRSLEGGLYMRSLSRREGCATLANVVLERLMRELRYQEVLQTAQIILRHHACETQALVSLGSAYGGLLNDEFEQSRPCLYVVPPQRRARYRLLCERNHAIFQALEALGWEPEE